MGAADHAVFGFCVMLRSELLVCPKGLRLAPFDKIEKIAFNELLQRADPW